MANPARSNLAALMFVLALSCLSFVGEGQEKAGDAKPDVNEIRAKVEKGDAQAQFDLGWTYDDTEKRGAALNPPSVHLPSSEEQISRLCKSRVVQTRNLRDQGNLLVNQADSYQVIHV